MPIQLNAPQQQWDTGSPLLDSLLESAFPQDPASSISGLVGPMGATARIGQKFSGKALDKNFNQMLVDKGKDLVGLSQRYGDEAIAARADPDAMIQNILMQLLYASQNPNVGHLYGNLRNAATMNAIRYPTMKDVGSILQALERHGSKNLPYLDELQGAHDFLTRTQNMEPHMYEAFMNILGKIRR